MSKEEEKKAPNKVLGIVALVLALVSGVFTMFLPENMTIAMIIVIVSIILALVAVVLGFMGMKGRKVCSIIAIIGGFLNIILLGLALVGLIGITQAKDCEKQSDGKYTCVLLGQKMEGVPGGFLNDSQMKK